jgi:hypothetical protein
MDSVNETLPQSPWLLRKLQADIAEIRLLTLLPGSMEDVVTCTVSIVSLLDLPSYEALSYVWGDESIRAPIMVNGAETTVTTNLESALRYIRLEDKDRVIWIDALCIDQSNTLERNQQVSIMSEIYRNCSLCVAWLGVEDENESHRPFDYIEAILSSDHIPVEECDGPRKCTTARAVTVRLLKRPYWTRAWVVQESVLPNYVEFYCGTARLDRSLVYDFGRKLVDHELSRCCTTNAGCSECEQLFNVMVSIDVAQLKTDDSGTGDATLDLMQILTTFRKRQCQQPVDHVFAYLGLAAPSYRSTIPVDYDASLADLLLQLFTADVQITNGLRMFYMLCNNEATAPGPSWLSFLQPGSTTLFGRQCPETEIYRNFNSSGSRELELRLEKTCESYRLIGNSLLVDAIDLVGVTDKESMDYTLNTPWILMALNRFLGLETLDDIALLKEDSPILADLISPILAPSYAGGGTLSNALYRTLNMDHIYNNKAARFDRVPADGSSSWWTFIQRIFLRRNGTEIDLNLEWTFWMASALLTEAKAFFITKKNLIGLGLDGIEPGDEIHILPGGNCPVILRRVVEADLPTSSDINRDQRPRYRVLGNCYVHGIMYGEAADDFEERATEIVMI